MPVVWEMSFKKFLIWSSGGPGVQWRGTIQRRHHGEHSCVQSYMKGALSWYGKLTWESAHAWNLIILCLLIVWAMTFIFMVHLSCYAIPLLIYDVMYGITTIP